MSRINLLIFLFLSFTWITVHSNSCTSNADCKGYVQYGEFSKCVANECRCLDFFTLSENNETSCLNIVKYGETCQEDNQCVGTMGNYGICNGTSVCDCEKVTDVEMVIFNGKCTPVKKLGGDCDEDGQCIAGSNQFARCVHGTCGCLSTDIIEFTPDDHGMCIDEENSCVDFSVFAATAAGSVALLLLIVIIYRVTNPNRLTFSQKTLIQNPKEVQRRSLSIRSVPSSSNSMNLSPGPSVKVEIP